jgi:regulator of protease activity HflC (stomatin/prohibitin superfamily)
MANSFELLAGVAVELALVVLAGMVIRRVLGQLSFLPSRGKLLPFNRGVILNGDSVERVVEPGACWIAPGRTLIPVDIRPKPFQVAAREVITVDNGAFRVAFGGEYKVIDPSLYVTESSDAFGTLYVALERVISSAAQEQDADTLLNTPSVYAERIQELIEPRAAQLGLRVTALEVSSAISLGWVLKPAES